MLFLYSPSILSVSSLRSGPSISRTVHPSIHPLYSPLLFSSLSFSFCLSFPCIVLWNTKLDLHIKKYCRNICPHQSSPPPPPPYLWISPLLNQSSRSHQFIIHSSPQQIHLSHHHYLNIFPNKSIIQFPYSLPVPVPVPVPGRPLILIRPL